jgi:hypothetical protein
MFIKDLFVKIAAITLVAFLGTAANAATVIYGDPGDYDGATGIAIAIQGLDIGGTLYNVDFADPDFDTFGGDADFWNTSSEALTAVNAINSLLNGEAVGTDPVAMGTAAAPLAGNYNVLYNGGLDAKAGFRNKSLDAGVQWSENTFAIQADRATSWSVVPVPGAVWLFGSALGGLGWVRRKRKA